MMVLVHGWYCQQLSQEYQPFILDRMEFLGAFHRAVLSPRSFASVQTCAESEAPILILMSELFFWTYIKFVYIYIDDQLCIFTPTHHYLSIYLYIIYIYTRDYSMYIYTYICIYIYIHISACSSFTTRSIRRSFWNRPQAQGNTATAGGIDAQLHLTLLTLIPRHVPYLGSWNGQWI